MEPAIYYDRRDKVEVSRSLPPLLSALRFVGRAEPPAVEEAELCFASSIARACSTPSKSLRTRSTLPYGFKRMFASFRCLPPTSAAKVRGPEH